jgi:protein ImuA
MIAGFSHSFPLRAGRTHEVCGPNAQSFAFALGGQLGEAVLWVCEGWQTDHINPAGFAPYMDPQNLLCAKTKDQPDGLAVAEEALRSGAVGLVVIELRQPLSFTAGRRLQLAAQTGGATGLCIIPEGQGNNAAETRWRCSPVFDPQDSTLQRWEIIKNKAGTLTAWDVRWDAQTRRIIVVSKASQ